MLLTAIADGAVAANPLWGDALRPSGAADEQQVFASLLRDARFALGLETIYEGYLLHYGRSRIFAPSDADVALLLGDTLLAHGLVRISATGSVAAVADLAELLALCAQGRAEGRDGDGAAWAATAACLTSGSLDEPRAALRDNGDAGPLDRLAREAAGGDAVEQALARHRSCVAG